MEKNNYPPLELKYKNRMEYYKQKFAAQTMTPNVAASDDDKKDSDILLKAAQVFEYLYNERKKENPDE